MTNTFDGIFAYWRHREAREYLLKQVSFVQQMTTFDGIFNMAASEKDARVFIKTSEFQTNDTTPRWNIQYGGQKRTREYLLKQVRF